jgi:hypothetical protein
MPQITVSDDTLKLLQNVLFLLHECGDINTTYEDAIRFLYECVDEMNPYR